MNFSMSELNKELRVGGFKNECEADEIALRCIAETRNNEPGFVWIRLFRLCRRRSFKIFLEALPERWCALSSKGGGGALYVSELEEILKVKTDILFKLLEPLTIAPTKTTRRKRSFFVLATPAANSRQ